MEVDTLQKYAALTESLNDCAIYTLDLQGNITSWSKNAQAMKGYRTEEVLGRSVSIFYTPEDVSKGLPLRALKLANNLGRHEEETWRVRKDGSRVWAHSIIVALRDPNGGIEGFFHLTRDLTERKRADERFRLAVESAPNAMVMVNQDGRIVLVNSQTEKLFGYTRNELIGARVELLIPRQFREKHSDDRREFYSDPKARPMAARPDLFGLRKDGRQFPVEVGLNPIETDEGVWVLSAIVDITERKRADQRFRLAVDSSPNAMVMVNHEGKIVLVNPQTEKLFGYTSDELIGAPVEMLVPQPFRGAHPELRAKFFADPRARAMGAGRDLHGLRKDGTQFPVEIGLNPIETDEGTWVLSAIVDITERKKAEESRNKLEAQIQQAQKLESLGVLAGGIAHDFNNLLVSILGHSGLALMELPPEAPARRTVQMIETAAIRAAELTKQLLAYSGKGKFVIQPINLSRLVHEMGHLLGVSISKKISFLTALPENLPCVEADAVQMQQVVMNLITNASEAIGDKTGVISVRTGVTHVDQEYLWQTYFEEELPEGEYIFLEVADSGAGIDPETKARIFDPFFTTKFTGRGLGLAAVLGIVRGHRGAINLYSEVGHGTTFKVLLPATEKKISLELTKTAERTNAWRGTGTVLVIDDEEGVRIVARTALERCGLKVLTADDGRAGLQVFRELTSEISLVLLDMTMPHMSGEEVFRELRRITPELPVIISSGYNEQDAISLFAGKRLSGFIQKPYQPLALIDKVRRTLEEAGHPPGAGLQNQGGSASGGA